MALCFFISLALGMTFISLKNKFAKNYHEVTKTPSREGKR
jgi:hypothetical protein